MGFFDSAKAFTDKARDLVVNAKAVFDKDCEEFICFSCDNLKFSENIKAKIIDSDKHLIQFTADTKKVIDGVGSNTILVDKFGKVLKLKDNTIESKAEQIELKSKAEVLDTFVIKFGYVKIHLIDAK